MHPIFRTTKEKRKKAMKKLFLYMTMMLAAVLLTTSCSNDDDDMSAENFAKAICATGWQGYNLYQYTEMGSWIDRDNDFVVIRFDRANATDTKGTGRQLQFENSNYNKLQEQSDFDWYISDGRIYITYKTDGWGRVNAIINDVTIRNDLFEGFWLTADASRRYRFSYVVSGFKDWDKYPSK